MISRLLVANRAEIASRVFRTCRRLGIGTVAVHSDADAGLPYVREADDAVGLPGDAPADTYLRIDLLVEAAREAGADAVHPGYGFLSENADFARAVLDAGLTWVGPPPESIEAMGYKVEAKGSCATPACPSSRPRRGHRGRPAGAGQGLRRWRRSRHAGRPALADLPREVAAAGAEALSAFGDGTVFVEPYVITDATSRCRSSATTTIIGERDCSLQRRHQKVVEEAPAPGLPQSTSEALRDGRGRAAEAWATSVPAPSSSSTTSPDCFWFLEMNTRLQVEHPVTELVQGVDLVALQLGRGPAGRACRAARGHAIEVRLYAEDPAADYQPQSGVLTRFEIPAGDGIRVDAGYESGSTVSTFYDAMLAKVVCHAPESRGRRPQARRHPRPRAHPRGRHQPGPAGGGAAVEAFLAGEVSHGVPRRDRCRARTTAGRAWWPLPSRWPTGRRRSARPAGHPRRLAQRAQPAAAHRVRQTARSSSGGEPRRFGGRRCRGAPATSLETTGVTLETDGVRDDDDVTIVGGGSTSTARPAAAAGAMPRFTDPADAVASGSLLAPMPGTVVCVLVERETRSRPARRCWCSRR